MHVEEFRIPRQKVLLGAGLALAATALAACTTYGKKPAPTSNPVAAPTTSGSVPATGSPAANVIAKTSDVPVGSGVIINDIVITQPSAGVFKGLSSTCTHQGCTVSEVAGETINCPCHGSKYNLDGSVAKGPAPRALAPEVISVQGTSIVRG